MTTFHTETPRKCPPNDATHSDGIYCRLVFNNPPTYKDFLIWIMEPENKHKLCTYKKKELCTAFAISMLTEAGILRRKKLFWRGMKKKAEKRESGFIGLAKVKLDQNSGVLKNTGKDPNHYSLWPYVNSKLEHNIISVEGI